MTRRIALSLLALLALAAPVSAQDSTTARASWSAVAGAVRYEAHWTGPFDLRVYTVETASVQQLPVLDTAYTAAVCVRSMDALGRVSSGVTCNARRVPPRLQPPPDPPGEVALEVDTSFALPPDTTVPPPPPPDTTVPDALWPNEPSGGVLAVDEPFTLRTLSPQPAGRWEWGNSGETTERITVEPNGEGGTAWRWSYPGGIIDGESPGRAVITSTAMQFRSVYIGVRVRWSVPWTPHTSGANKILYWGSMEAREELGHGPGQFYINRRGDLIDLTLQYAQANGQSNVPAGARTRSTNVGDGQWHRVELLMDGNAAGVADCRVRVWVDGLPEFDVGGLVCANGEARFYGLNLDPIWGGRSQEKPPGEWIEMDHVRVSGRD